MNDGRDRSKPTRQIRPFLFYSYLFRFRHIDDFTNDGYPCLVRSPANLQVHGCMKQDVTHNRIWIDS
ncbi:hypothetical protein GQ602_007042 [Ophiocordyceps camponoti-floridani]|uniref:Uncharacterized protein n=1 Tax=Ophiocordyceps camponoti-floridani TaxID=2030778 RepID=A0A8H4Q0M0_9HYPO|nr:hypothetical protein GQ602_007042 [Ophiocordyceps camponoti-floridani]